MFLETFSSIDKIDVDLLQSFEKLEPDCFLRENHVFRYRAFGEAVIEEGDIRWVDKADFFQSSDVNSYIGGVVRKFPPIGKPARRFAEAMAIDSNIRKVIGNQNTSMGCHQIRITASNDFNGTPTPEGFHRDGFHYVAVTCLAARNINGGASLLSLAGDPDRFFFDRPLNAGETMFFDDAEFKHYVAPFTPKIPGKITHRDTIVLTFDLL